MRMPTQRRKPRKADLATFQSPTAGLVRNRNLAIPAQQGLMPGASVLRNFFPSASSVTIRRGSKRWASLPLEADVRAMWTYDVGTLSQMFAAMDGGIWETTLSVDLAGFYLVNQDGAPIGTQVLNQVIGKPFDLSTRLYSATSGDWSVLQFSTAGGTFLIGVNGVDTGFIYDGIAYYPYVAGGILKAVRTGAGAAFQVGEILTQTPSGATGIVVRVVGSDIYLRTITGAFVAGQAATGSMGGAAATLTVPVLTIPGLTGITSNKLSYVWAYKQRIYFVEANTLNAWYLPVDSLGGTATILPLGGVFALGGSLQWGHTWSLNTSGSGGLSEQCVFTTTEGEVAAYQGLSPDSAATWDKVGVYRIGRPMGKKAFIRAGGDLLIATTVGFVSLGAAAQLDLAALGRKSVSYPIEDLWARAIQERGSAGWNCRIWPEGQAVFISPPTPVNEQPILLVANANTGAWCEYTGWDVTSMVNFNGRFFYGTALGRVIEGNVTGADQGNPYTAEYLSLFDDIKTPASRKVAKMARAVTRGVYDAPERVSVMFDYNETMPSPPDAPIIPIDGTWDNGVWEQSTWNAVRGSVVTDRWHSVSGSGYVAAVAVQITSGGAVPLDIELIRADMTVETSDLVT